MSRYYCSGFDPNNAFGHGLGDMFICELKDQKSIVYIPGRDTPEKIEKTKEEKIPQYIEHLKKIGITFDKNILITPDMNKEAAQKAVREASFVMLMGGDPINQKEMCAKLGLLEELKKYKGVMLGYSAGAMLMSKYIIITPCSEEYPDFHIEEGLNLDGISIYPHNNTNQEEYPNSLVVADETYQKEDLIKVADEYGEYYLLQDYYREDGLVDISIIKSSNNQLEIYTENEGKIWVATPTKIELLKKDQKSIKNKR